jgi:hypothetical protein
MPERSLTRRKDQVWIGVAPTLLALVGWLLLAARALRDIPSWRRLPHFRSSPSSATSTVRTG